MTDAPSRRRPTALVAASAVVALVTVTGTILRWRTTLTPTAGIDARSAWTSGTWAVVGAALAVLGAVAMLVGAVMSARRSGMVAVRAGAAAGVVGVVVLLVDRFRPAGAVSVAPVTVAIASFTPDADFGAHAAPSALPWVTTAGLGALVVLGLAFPARTERPGRRTVGVAAAVGAVLFLLGATALPWTFGSTPLAVAPLWRSGTEGVVAAVLVLLGALVLVTTVRWRASGSAVAAALSAAGGLGVLLAQRVPNPWGDRVTGWYAYQPLDTVSMPPAWRFHAATTLVLLGAAVVVVTASLAGRAALYQGRVATKASL